MHGNASTPLLDARQLSKSYGERALFHIDALDLHRGEATLLTGRNGAGKSTLLKVLAGLEPQHGGRLRYCGTPLTQRRHRQLGGKVIYLHQHPYLFDTTVANNIGYGLKHLSSSQRQRAIDRALDWSGLSHLRERRAKTLSGGEKQRIALARAWVMEPELLLLDEPTANMDAEAREQTLFLIRRLINDGVAVVLCSHELKVDKRLIRRQLHLEDGVLHERSTAAASDSTLQQSAHFDNPVPLMQLTEA
ncbi:energy-coupling factor ABC transporter ATP-binding protein [Motiliproteus sp.]|uniref:energy-coupling factor ABC transporter ATP-binding protein n=1 Tax=Motiliproteus sp. TaxID=1898955 RepID=UPI003BA9E6BB